MSYRYMKFAGQVRWLALSLALGATGAEAATANPDDVRSVAEDFAPIPVALSGSFSGVSGTATYTYLGSTGVTAATVGLNPATGDVTLTAVADANGSQTLTFQVKDDGGDADRPWRLTLNVAPMNDMPTVTGALANVSVAEDTPGVSVPFVGTFDDVDILTNGDALTYSAAASGDPLFDAVTISGGNVALDLAPDQNGVATVAVRATDTFGASVETTFQFTVTALNDAPVVIAPPGSSTFPEDSAAATVDFSGVFYDIDGDVLTLSVAGTTAGGYIDSAVMNGATLELTLLADQNGTGGSVLVRATDGSGAFVEAPVAIDVSPVDDVPVVVGAVSDLAVAEDAGTSSVDLSGVFDDADIPDGDTLTYSVSGTSGDPLFDAVAVAGATVDLTHAPNQNGLATVTVRATDSSGLFAETSFQVTVGASNDAPVVVAAPVLSVFAEDTAGATVDLAGVFDDPDLTIEGDTLTLSVAGVSGGGYLDTAVVSGTSLQLTLLADQNGTGASVTVRATDTGGLFADVTVDVEVTPVADAPVLVAPIADQVVDEDAGDLTINLAGVFADADIVPNGDTLTYTIATLGDPLFASTDVSGANLTLDFAGDQNGVAQVTVRATDATGSFVEDAFQVTVNPQNDAPVVASPIGIQTFTEDTPASLSLVGVFDDPDLAIEGDVLTLTVVGIVAGGYIDTATITGTNLDLTFIADQNGGGASVSVRATDSAGAYVEHTIGIDLNPAVDAPVIVAPIADVTVNEDAASTTIDLSGVFDDPDIASNGDILTYTVSTTNAALFDSLTVSGATLDIDYGSDANGVATLTVRATDSTGNFVDTTFQVTVNPVNDAPYVAAPIGDINAPEDGPDIVVDLTSIFDDVDIGTNGDTLTLSISGNPAPALFGSANLTGTTLTLSLRPDRNGTASVDVTATDAAGEQVTDTFVVTIFGVNDVPVAQDDTATMAEDAGPLLIDVLVNDYLAETPTTIVTVGVGGNSESAPTTVLNELGDPVTEPNGRVTVVGNQIEYEPKADFYGDDFFTYTIQDSEGDAATATVRITVTPVNDAPVGLQERTFLMQENGSLVVDAATGLLKGAYDVDGALLDASGAPLGSALTVEVVAFPVTGALTLDQVAGTFDYLPPVNFIGEVVFEYRLNDGIALSAGAGYRVRVVVLEAPEPPAPPPAGQVAITYQLANAPLEQSTSVPPNVLVVMDDSGSMDWNLIVSGAGDDGGFELDNSAVADRADSTSFTYLWDLPSNAYPPSSSSGRVLPTTEALATGNTVGNSYAVWRARNHTHNQLYYNPEIQYTPWVGQDASNEAFADADPGAIRLDPVDPTNLFDMLAPHSYRATQVPEWDSNGGRDNVDVVDLYIPHYYTTAATPPLTASDTFDEKVEIRPANAPFTGGRQREDCALDDGDAYTCTYEQEIQNFANYFQYYRSREHVTKYGIGATVADLQGIRVGYETISATTSEPIREMNPLLTEGNKKALLDNIYQVDSYGGTPLRQALGRAGQIFGCDTGNDCPALPAPEGFCQQNFALIFSDGYWNGGTGTTGNPDADGPSDGDTPFDGGRYEDAVGPTLADVAMHYYETDIHPGLYDGVPLMRRDIEGVPDGVFSGSDPKMHQHMKTYAIAFGVAGTVDPDSIPSDPAQPFNWPDPFDGNLEKIDDLLHTAVNGRGRFLNAANPVELKAAFESAFLEFTQAASSTSSAAFNSTSLRDGTLLYRGFYDLRDNTGELTATHVNADGSLEPVPQWLASQRLNPSVVLPGNRVITTFDPTAWEGSAFEYVDLTPEQKLTLSEGQVDYLRGLRVEEVQNGGRYRDRPIVNGLLGDIVNSSPVFVGSPRSINRDQRPYPTDDLYSDFAGGPAGSRTPVVYVGANDGMLHGFDATTGDELFAYVPNKIIDASQKFHNSLDDVTSPFYQHRYYVDLSPRLNDVYMRSSRSAVDRSWNTVLVGGLGAGGKGFFALNVTDPDGTLASSANSPGAVLWEFTDQDDSYPLDATGTPLGGAVGAVLDANGAQVRDLGYALSLPVVAMSNVVSGGGDNEWVALFGNGINSTAGYAKLFVLFMDGGLDGWQEAGDFVKLDTGFGVPAVPHAQAGYPNGLGSPAAVDIDLNGTVDRVYVGDRLGNLFRFDLSDSDPDNWSVTRLFTATYDTGAGETVQPILAAPLVIKHPDEQGFLVIFGTGSYLTQDDADSEDIQSIYAIWDRGTASPETAASDSKSLRLVEQTITNVVDDSVSPAVTRRVVSRTPVNYQAESAVPGTYGWYIDLDMPRATTTLSGAVNPDTSGRTAPEAQYPGEKAIRRLLYRDGTIITTTVLPSLDEFSCFGTRPGSIILFDALTGGDAARPVFDANTDGYIDDRDLVSVGGDMLAGGILFNQGDLDGQLVDLSTLGGEGDTDFLFVSGGNDTVSYRIEDLNDNRTGRLSWHELEQQ